ncbi:MAG: CaiB/BaiF CoA transferase family protein [Burkholderiaceae bacterium]
MNSKPSSSSRPLEGLRVLEFGQIAAGPFAGSLLADLGADVVKVERPDGGDGMRVWPPINKTSQGSYSENFASVNRNKRSITADMKSAKDLAHLKALAAKADILLENFRPGVLDRLGLGYEALAALNPGLVYCSISGYGQEGPYAQKGAFDVTVQAMSGLMSVTGEEGAPPVKAGVPVGDFGAGLYAVVCILAAVHKRHATGLGARIDCSMLGGLLGMAALQTSEFFGTGQVPKRLGSAHPRNAPYKAFKASDDYFVIAAGNDKLWQTVCELVGLPELAEAPDFKTQLDRARNQTKMNTYLDPVFVQKSASEWLVLFDKAGVPCAPINNYADILSDPHVKAMQWVQPIDLPNGATTQTVAFPMRLAGVDLLQVKAPPQLGEHNAEVNRAWLG